MKGRPQNPIGKAIVVFGYIFLRQIRERVLNVSDPLARKRGYISLRALFARPSHPETIMFLQR